jgi:ATP-binding cassette subfamily F protein 3
MNNVGTHVLFLGGTKPLFRKGAYDDFLAWQAEMDAQRAREEKRLEDELAKKMDFVRRFSAKATKARQSQAKKKQAQKLERQLDGYRPEKKRKTLAFSWPEPARSEKTVLSVVDLDFAYSGKRLWPPLSFNIYRGQRVALAGPNGSGKTTLLKLITGELDPASGRIDLGAKVDVAYYSQHQLEILDPARPTLAEIRRLSDPHTTEEELMSVLGLFLLGQEYFDRPVSALSGGEKSRLVLATLFLRRANFLVLDEPTNHLDLETRETLIGALERFPGTILVVAHDRWLLRRVAEQVWVVGTGGLTVHEDGWAGYDRARHAADAPEAPGAAGAGSGSGAGAADAGLRLDREAQKRLKRERAEERNKIYKELKPKQDAYAALEAELTELLDELGELEATLAKPETYADSALMSGLLQTYQRRKEASEELMERMEGLEKELRVLEQRRAALAGGE